MLSLFKRDKNPKNRILSEIKSIGFNEVEKVIELIKPTVLLDSTTKQPIAGASKFGGQPDLPKNYVWPKFNDAPMAFLCQISLSELKNFDSGLSFQKTGLLSIFHYFENPENEFGAEYDFYPPEKEYKILFFDNNENLEPTQHPENLIKEYKFKEEGISFIQSYQIPGSDEHSIVIDSSLSEADKEKLFDYADEYMDIFQGQIGGHPLPFQDGADLDWTSSKFPKVEYLSKEHIEKALSFENLLSFSFQFNFEAIGDSNIYIGVTKDDLKQSNFENAIIIHQAT